MYFLIFCSDDIIGNALRARKELPKIYRESQKRTDYFGRYSEGEILL